MLRFIKSFSRIQVRREFSGDCICLLTENFEGEYEPHFQTSTVTPEELHQVADKLEELNKE
ncbi:hypothetical protein [Nitrosomonas sp. Is79A3]|uniref:hypothetical protein n=1 Tax=Nitrosomonas sp. (strain Is79A3) TaxID=261292 RepID=UPI00059C846E